jgi:hypothetical protein
MAAAAIALGAGCGGGGGGGGSGSPGSGQEGSSGDQAQASAGPIAGYTPTGTLVADNGFRPEKNGFGFENYGGDVGAQDLTPAQMKEIFGDQVCADQSNGQCTLTPPAQAWMDNENKSMAGGHCMGFSIASLQFFKDQLKPTDFGGDSTTALALAGNGSLQQKIAEGFAYQDLQSVRDGTVKGTPTEVLDKLIEALKANADTYTLGIYKRDGTGGHAITPFAVEDQGGGKMGVLAYDNNYPKVTRVVQFDRNADTWSYQASTNPSEPSATYEGDANTRSIDFSPTKPGEGVQPCPFCTLGSAQAEGGQQGQQGSKGSAGSGGGQGDQFYEVSLEGTPDNHAHLVLTDDQGNQTGYVNGKLVEDIEGVQVNETKSDKDWRGGDEPNYRIPVGTKVAITLDGSSVHGSDDSETLTMTGPGYDAIVQDIKIAEGQKDKFEVSPDATSISYTTDPAQSESPVLALGFQAQGPDYGFAIKAGAVEGGSTISVSQNETNHQLVIDTTGTKQAGTYGVAIHRIDKNGEQDFSHPNLQLGAGAKATVDYAGFTEHGQGLPLTIDENGQQRTETLSD